MLKRIPCIICGLLAFWTVEASAEAQTIDASEPSPIFVNGHLEDEKGRALDGKFKWEVRFYADATTTTELGKPASGTLHCDHGVFSIKIGALDFSPQPFWFSLAVDTNRNGIDANDLFADRFEVSTLPSVCDDQPTPFFTANTGSLRGFGYGGGVDGTMHVTPFCAPAGGVKFNRMSTVLFDCAKGNTFSFGIYDSKGKLVATSGPVVFVKDFKGSVEAVAAGELHSSKLYYAAFSASGGIVVGASPFVPIPGTGLVRNAAANGVIPKSFDPDKLTDPMETMPISITLRKAKSPDQGSIGAASQTQEPPRIKFLEFKEATRDKPTTLSLQGIRIMR